MLASFEDVELVGEASDGVEAVKLIERERPDLALLDLQMPELDGLGVVRLIDRERMPLIAFVTAYDQHAVRAFELNAVDYLLKPVERGRLQKTLIRAGERADLRARETERLEASMGALEALAPRRHLDRIPVRHRGDIVLLPVERLASVVAEGELLHLTMEDNRRFSITHSLRDLEARLAPELFVRLSRGALAAISQIDRISPLPGGTYLVTLRNGQELSVSRLQSRILRERILRI